MSAKFNKVSVIDVFAGPGGLGEGFSGCENSKYQIRVSVEYEANAHKTLTLRSFFRKLTEEERINFYLPYIRSTSEQQKTSVKQSWMSQADLKAKWDEACFETLNSPHALGNLKKWKKINSGETPTSEDSELTPHEKNIFGRIKTIRDEAIAKNHPIVLIGGPPCQAYSVNGRNRIRAEKNYTPENDERFFLYLEYLKIIDAAEPDIFVMENVEGILSAKLASGERIFDRIRPALARKDENGNDRYNIYSLSTPPNAYNESGSPIYKRENDFVVNASDYGVPQARKRVILLGVKTQYGKVDTVLTKNNNAPSTKDVIGDLPKLRSSLSKRSGNRDDEELWHRVWEENIKQLEKILQDKKEIDGIVARSRSNEANSTYSVSEHILMERESEVKAAFAKTLVELKKCWQLSESELTVGHAAFLATQTGESALKESFPQLHKWLIRSGLNGVANHTTRGHMKEDLLRYLFSALWTRAHSDLKSPCPKSKDFPPSLSPEHKNWESGNHADRFRTIGENMVPLTITSHLRKDGHAQIHFDPTQNRSLTVREAARIQTFPDDYYFEGTTGWQYQQVGNAVPPFLAKQIAEKVLEIIQNNGMN